MYHAQGHIARYQSGGYRVFMYERDQDSGSKEIRSVSRGPEHKEYLDALTEVRERLDIPELEGVLVLHVANIDNYYFCRR